MHLHLHKHFLWHLIVRWADFAAMVMVIGFVTVYRGILAQTTVYSKSGNLQRRLGLGLACMAVSSLADLVLRVQMMTERPLADIASILPIVLSQTHYGKVWIARQLIIGGLLLFWGWERKMFRNGCFPWLIGSAFLCLTSALSGHAANRGTLSIAVLVDWLHLVAITTWIGGVWSLRSAFKGISGLPQAQAELLLRFSRVATLAVMTLTLTGIVATRQRLPDLMAIVRFPWGMTLIGKLVLVGITIGIGGSIRIFLLPQILASCHMENQIDPVTRAVFSTIQRWRARFGRGSTKSEPTQQLLIWLKWEAIAGGLVLLTAALLTLLPPPPFPL